MLVLDRKINSTIIVETEQGNKQRNVEFTIIRCGKHSVVVGIEAPKEFRILRSETLK